MYDKESFKNKLNTILDNFQTCKENLALYDQYVSELRMLLSNINFCIDEVLLDPEIKIIQETIQRTIAHWFYFTEEIWANKIINTPYSSDILLQFPDYDEYNERINFELKKSASPKTSKILFVGSGPIPITPVLLAKKQIHVDCIDIRKDACDLAKEVVEKLGLKEFINFFVTDILDFHFFEEYDVIWVAVLVGENKNEKSKIVRYLCEILNNNQSLILRTGYDVGKFLYAEVNIEDLIGVNYIITEETPFSDNIQTYYIHKQK